MNLFIAAVFALAAPDVPPPFAVCVTTIERPTAERLDSYHATEADAEARADDILANGWIKSQGGTQSDRIDRYPARSIVKATIDPTLVGESACVPAPPAPPASASE